MKHSTNLDSQGPFPTTITKDTTTLSFHGDFRIKAIFGEPPIELMNNFCSDPPPVILVSLDEDFTPKIDLENHTLS